MPTESPIFSEVDQHIGKVPWYGLSVCPEAKFTYQAAVRPLNGSEIEYVINKRSVARWRGRDSFSQTMRLKNQEDFDGSDSLVIVLDGRINGKKEGFLGDMVEATRLIRPFSQRLKEVIIATPHTDVFDGRPDQNVSVLPIPEDIGGVQKPPWDEKLRRFLYNQVGEIPCIFPINADNISYAIFGPNGEIKNESSFILARDAIRYGYQGLDIGPANWWKKGVHQLQALQIMYHLLGGEDAKDWQQFPDAYLYPSDTAVGVAKEAVNRYGCFSSSGRVCPPVYLHIGVATNGKKMEFKYYPEEKWAQVLKGLAENPAAPNSVTFLEPSDPDHAKTALSLAQTAVDNGLRVAKIPTSQLRSEWTLGAFIAFLQELSRHKGMIVGCDSMPAGHAGPAIGNPAVVLGSPFYNPGFYCPPQRSLVVMPNPSESIFTSGINPEHVVGAIVQLCRQINQ